MGDISDIYNLIYIYNIIYIYTSDIFPPLYTLYLFVYLFVVSHPVNLCPPVKTHSSFQDARYPFLFSDL